MAIRQKKKRRQLYFGQLKIGGLVSLGQYHYLKAEKGLLPHSHKGEIEICFLSKGQQTYEVNQKKYQLKGGDFFFTLPDEKHGTGEFPQDKGYLYWLILKLKPAPNNFLGLGAIDGNILIEQLLNLNTRHFKGKNSVSTILEDIFLYYDQKKHPLRKTKIQNKVLTFLLNFLDCAVNFPKDKISIDIQKTQNEILENINQDLTIDELAQKIHLSVSRFKTKFKNQVGMPPGEYILRQKIEQAKYLLSSTEKSVTEIAFNLSFSSSQYFATVFKKFTRLTPRQFQARNPDYWSQIWKNRNADI